MHILNPPDRSQDIDKDALTPNIWGKRQKRLPAAAACLLMLTPPVRLPPPDTHPAPVLRDPAEQPGFDLIGQPPPVAVYKSARRELRSAEGLGAHGGHLLPATWTTSAPPYGHLPCICAVRGTGASVRSVLHLLNGKSARNFL